VRGLGFQSRRLTFTVANYTEVRRHPAALSIFAAAREVVRRNLNKFPNDEVLATTRRLALPPSPTSTSGLVHPLPYSAVTLSFSRWRCRKSRVHFPHFSPSWRTASSAVRRRGRRRGRRARRRRGWGRENARPRNFTFRGCETSPLRSGGQRAVAAAAAGANDILPRYLVLIPEIILLVCAASVLSGTLQTNCRVLQSKSGIVNVDNARWTSL